MRYGDSDLGCRYRGVPHDLRIIAQNKRVKREVCTICNKQFRFNKGHKDRVDNKEYLTAHVRNFAQRTGPTRRIYHRIYRPNETIIKL